MINNINNGIVLAKGNLTLLCNNRNNFHRYCTIGQHLKCGLRFPATWNIQESNFLTYFKPRHVDEISQRIIPSIFTPRNYIPVRTTGDGNCLFNSASLLICHNESLASELRLRTCLELALNREYYKQHPVIKNVQISCHSKKDGPRTMSIPTVFDIACFAADSSKVYEKQGFEAALDHEIMRTSVDCSYSGTLQIMGLASVLGVPLETVYPEQYNSFLPIYQNTFHPRNALGNIVVRIMWTNTNGWPDKSKEFTVNHFVPLLQENHGESTSLNNLCGTKLEDGWQLVTNKKKSARKRKAGQKRYNGVDKERCTNISQVEQRPRKLEHCHEDKFKENAKQEEHHAKNSRKRKQDSVKSHQDRATDKQKVYVRQVFPEKKKAKHRATGKISEEKASSVTKQSDGFSKKGLKVQHRENNEDLVCVQTNDDLVCEAHEDLVCETHEDLICETQTINEDLVCETHEDLVCETHEDLVCETHEDLACATQTNEDLVCETHEDLVCATQTNEDLVCETHEDLVCETQTNEDRPMRKKCDVKDTESQKDRDEAKREDCGNEALTKNKKEQTKGQLKPKEYQDDKNEHTMSSNGEGTQDETTDNNKKKLLFGGKYQMKTKTDEIRELKTTSVSEINYDDINKLYISKNVECIQYLQSRAALPFPGASRRFYAGQYVKTTKNIKRESRRMKTPVLCNANGNDIIGMLRSKVEGTLDQNKESIEKQSEECKDETKRLQLLGIAEVAKELKKVILMKTSRALEIYKTTKVKFSKTNAQISSTCFRAVDTYEMLSKYLNVAQIYIDQQAFIVQSSGTDIKKVVNSISSMLENRRTSTIQVNQTVQSCLKDSFKDALCYLDTKRDRDVLEAIVTKVTSVNTVVSLKGTKCKGSVRGHLATFQTNLDKYKDIKQKAQTIRSDMTVPQQHAHVLQKTRKMKEDGIQIIAKGRGRTLKCEEFPELSKYIEFAFGDGDRVMRAGGGLQADPRLLDTKLFKAADNATVMRHVKELLATVKPNFQISTSCLYTYTQNYRKGTEQAKRHHHGKDINANVSLHFAPNTAEHIYPINSHWSSSHVNYLVDSASENSTGFLLDSKDAKCIVCGDISPVLKPGRSWRNFETPDHTFDQSRKNAVTPMTHLFMETKNWPQLENAELLIPETDVVLNVTRTGKAITLINLSLTEPETVFHVFNELFYLMSLPSLDEFFRNQETRMLKEIFGFIVDNGPSEAPSSFLVKMLLVRLLKFLDLDKVTQRSFAEYLSKRNFVERVHTIENKVLSDHGPFSSKSIHKVVVLPGSKEHTENMECMAEEVVKCIGTGIFNKERIKCFRGIGSRDNFIFCDEEQLKTFMQLSDEKKKNDCTIYRPVANKILSYLENVWLIKKDFKSTYGEDYSALASTETACLDKYSTSIFRENDMEWKGEKPLERFDRQPLPDYKRWKSHGDLHYMSYEARKIFRVGPWDESPGIFLPGNVLDTCFKAISSPSADVMESIAFLAWVSTKEAAEYFINARQKLQDQKEEDIKRESWKGHTLYKENKDKLANMCIQAGLSCLGNKHDLVRRIVENNDVEPSHTILTETDFYDGNLSSVANSTAGLMKASVAYLRVILRTHNVLEIGTKEELITRVGLLKAGYPEAAFSRDRLRILHIIAVAKEIANNQEDDPVSSVRRTRTFAHGKDETLTTRNMCLKSILTKATPTMVDTGNTKQNVNTFLAPLETVIAQQEEKARAKIDELEKESWKDPSTNYTQRKKKLKDKGIPGSNDENIRRSKRKQKVCTKTKVDQICTTSTIANIFYVGEEVEVLWNIKDLEGTNWQPGWYRGEIQQYDEDSDTLHIWSAVDQAVYCLDASSAIADEIIRPFVSEC